jgi:hypothetical protein
MFDDSGPGIGMTISLFITCAVRILADKISVELIGMNKTVLKAIEYGLTAAGLLIGILFVVLIIRGV